MKREERRGEERRGEERRDSIRREQLSWGEREREGERGLTVHSAPPPFPHLCISLPPPLELYKAK